MASISFRDVRSFLQRTGVQIVLTSFLTLFFELLLIRWLAAYFLHLAYFSNLVLLASFFGIGLGCLLADRREQLFGFFPWFLLAMVLLAATRINISWSSSGAIYFQCCRPGNFSTVPLWAVVPLLFPLVALVFVGPAQKLGRLFQAIPPLQAYTWDIVGSLAGIAAFGLCSFLGTGPLVWFAIAAAAYLALTLDDWRASLRRNAAAYVLAFLAVGILSANAYWSPYYKIQVMPLGGPTAPKGWQLTANESGHQSLQRPEDKEWIYQTPYALFNDPTYRDVLIIGSGGGTDVALALQKGAAHVDAVDIDPVIVELGRKLHPSKPYADPRVDVTIADGRNFLERTDKKYDMIIFALTDSLALASSYSNTRLESYLYTQESIERAKTRLNDGGLMVVYNYYRQPWLVQKIGGMLQTVFGQKPYILSSGDPFYLASLMVGPKLRDLKSTAKSSLALTEKYPPATDVWPFLYLQRPSLPLAYVIILVILALVSLGAIAYFLRRGSERLRGFPWHFFFLGAGFLLLETKNVINFQLLFGSTWTVSALVFMGIMVMVLAAVLLSRRGWTMPRNAAYLALLAILLFDLLIPLRALSPLPGAWRYLAAALLTLSPVFFANLIFSQSFRDSDRPNVNFAANLLGSMAGGIAEFSAMAIGYDKLLLVIMAFYAASWLTVRGRSKQ